MEPKGDMPPRKKNAKAVKNPNIKAPDDFDSVEDFLTYARKLYEDDRDADQENRDAAIEDAEFFAGKQWESTIKQRREQKRKPVLTVNRTVAFVGQIVGTRRMNDTQIKVLPEHGGTRKIAETRQGLIRNCEKKSKADRAYDTALQNCVVGGIGNFGVCLDYARFDVFEQDIVFKEYPDAFSVVWDRLSVDKTGRDANHVFVTETITRNEYENRYPWATPSEFVDLDADAMVGWFDGDDVRLVDFWRMRYRPATIAMLQSGEIVDITDLDEEDRAALPVMVNPATGQPYVRETQRPYAEKYVLSGSDILEGPYELEISRVPVFRVPAWEITINGTRHRFGLVRFLKDPQRLHNYWRSTIAEKLMMAPRARWMASDAAVSGREAQWREAHLSDDPLLVWNGESGQPPVFTPPAQIEVALVQEANMSVQDLRDVSNLHEASLGQQSNEVSGKAIVARQRVGDIGTVVYHDNLNAAIGEAGEVVNELIPAAYPTARIIRTLGADDKEAFQKINDPNDPESLDIGVGLYSVHITTGPSTATRRVEAQEAMLSVFNAAPQVFANAADLWAEQLDFPGSEKLAKRLRQLMPPNLIDPEDLDEKEREQYEQQLEASNQAAQLKQQVEVAQLQAELAEQKARTDKAMAEARFSNARAESEEIRRDLMRAQANSADAAATKAFAEALLTGVGDEAARRATENEQQLENLEADVGSQLFNDDMLQPETEGSENE